MDWHRFSESGEATYFLFTKLKNDRTVKIPNLQRCEAKVLSKIEMIAQDHFILLDPDQWLAHKQFSKTEHDNVHNTLVNDE